MKLSFVVPVYKGEKTIERLTDKIFQHFKGLTDFEIIFVNDCGRDNSWNIIRKIIKERSGNIKGIKLDKNRGQHFATLIGLFHSTGDIAVTIDEDIQYEPGEIPHLINILETGNYDMVYGVPDTAIHNNIRNIGSSILKRLLILSNPGIHPDYSSLRIIKKELINNLKNAECPYFFIDACLCKKEPLIISEKVSHNKRENGQSSYTFTKLLIHFIKLIFAYTRFLNWIKVCSLLLSGLLLFYCIITVGFVYLFKSKDLIIIILLLILGSVSYFVSTDIRKKTSKQVFNNMAMNSEIII
jgi:undecaprenyl-phosphate 4-deoxy-4-formamido-L-arabinose transferase